MDFNPLTIFAKKLNHRYGIIALFSEELFGKLTGISTKLQFCARNSVLDTYAQLALTLLIQNKVYEESVFQRIFKISALFHVIRKFFTKN